MQPNVIISVSAHTTNALHAMLGTSAKEIITIPNGVDIETIEKSPISDKTSDIVFAGRLLPHKNVDALLRALQHIQKQKPNISTIIIGDGPEKERLEKISLELGLEKNVSFLGFLPDHVEVYGVLKASRVFVLPSVREGFGITVVEANACGLPVVTIDSEHNAAKDLIDPRGNGMLASLNSEVLASAIMVFLDARKEQDRYKRYAERYNWNSLVGDITALYRKTYE
ncbi:MAG: glycosyltransferase [Patescibacteria group bacterium]